MEGVVLLASQTDWGLSDLRAMRPQTLVRWLEALSAVRQRHS